MATAIWIYDLSSCSPGWSNEINDPTFRGDGKRVVIAKNNIYEGVEAKQ